MTPASLWGSPGQRRAHNREAVELMVHRMARRVLHAALLSWRAAAQERRVRRTAIVRFIQVRCSERGSCAQAISNCLAVPDERIAAGMLAFSSQLEFASHLPVLPCSAGTRTARRLRWPTGAACLRNGARQRTT